MRELRLKLAAGAGRSVGVHVGAGALDPLVDRLTTRDAGRLVAVVSDSNVATLHGEPFRMRLESRGARASLVVFPAGEASKTRETKAALEDRLAGLGADRDTVIVALGGGVTCDLAGFLAATWLRGVALVQAPTSLLAMADAAVGGKTGVDLPCGKNLIGAFHQPWAVYADTGLLATLPQVELVRGLAEVVKSAVVGDAALFRRIEREPGSILRRDPAAIERAVADAVRVKTRIVSLDEREAGPRAALNFGHTVGHAIETASGYRVSHGEAVAIGMAIEARIAIERVGFPPAHAARLEAVLEELGLPTCWPEAVPTDAVLDAAGRDKKRRNGRIRCALPARIGAMPHGASGTTDVPEDRLRRALESAATSPEATEAR